MCGIAGRYSVDGLIEDGNWARRVSALLQHRGPDGEGYYRNRFCELVHRRLALIDLTATGEQPMTNEDGSIQMVYNGEVYDFSSLRSDLIRKGHAIRGTSDTEVLVHLYEECGTEMFSMIHGIYAFALYDAKKNGLLLARDRFGTKPLYYAKEDGQWIFASEIKAILAWPGFRPEIDHQAVYDFLGWGYVPEPATGFKNIHSLSKGQYLWISAEGAKFQAYYTAAPAPEYDGGLEDAVKETGTCLTEAIRYQQVADVPVASLLSGGIDSGLVTAAYSKVTTQDLFTFTVSFSDSDYDESALAQQSAEYLNTRHTIVHERDFRLTEDEAVDLLTHFDQPFADTSLFAVNLVAKAIHEKGLRAALSGDGGDEAFGGYMFFSHLDRLLSLRKIPEASKRIAEKGSRILLGAGRPGSARQIHRAMDVARNPSPAEFLAEMISYIPERQKERLVPAEKRDGLLPASRLYEPYTSGWSLEQMSTQLTNGMFHLLLPGEMLKKVDMMSMRHSVEIRVPILDEAVIAFAHSLPHRLKATSTRNKLVLRRLARQWLPAEISAARKHGFGIPMDVIASQRLKSRIKETLTAPSARTRAFLDPVLVGHWAKMYEDGLSRKAAMEISREGLYQRMFFLFSLELWMQKNQLAW